MLVAGEGKAPTRVHLSALAKRVDVKRADRIIDEVATAVSRFPEFAEQAGVPPRLAQQTAKALGIAARTTRTR
jgi:hypothetical protein